MRPMLNFDSLVIAIALALYACMDQQARLRHSQILAMAAFALLRLVMQKLIDSLTNGYLTDLASHCNRPTPRSEVFGTTLADNERRQQTYVE